MAISGKAAAALEQILASVSKTTDIVGEIAAASQEQSSGIDQINSAIAEMDKMTQQNAAGAEESAGASRELKGQVYRMRNIVSQMIAIIDGRRQEPPEPEGLSLTDQPLHSIAQGPPRETAGASAITFDDFD